MNVLISTVPRSGSTLLFNICRLLFEQVYGINETYATWCQFHKESNEKNTMLLKYTKEIPDILIGRTR